MEFDRIRQWLVDCTLAVGLCIVPHAVAAVAVIIPAGMIQDGIKAYSVKGHAGINGGTRFRGNIGSPAGTRIVFGTGLRNEHRTQVALMHFGKDFTEGPILRLVPPDGLSVIPPLIAVVVIEADDVQVVFAAS